MMNKRGDRSIWDSLIPLFIILMVAGMAVWYFTGSFSSATSQIKISKSSVDAFIKSCDQSCLSEKPYDFCSQKQEIKLFDPQVDKQARALYVTCQQIAEPKTDNDKALASRGVVIAQCPGLCPDTPAPVKEDELTACNGIEKDKECDYTPAGGNKVTGKCAPASTAPNAQLVCK